MVLYCRYATNMMDKSLDHTNDGTSCSSHPGQILRQMANSLLFVVLGIMAALTVLTHAAQIVRFSFRSYAILAAGLSLSVLTLALWKVLCVMRCREVWRDLLTDRMAVAGLLAACIMGTLLAVFLYRTDTDDSYYTSNAVYYYEHPDEPMGFKIHGVDSGDEKPFVSYHFGSIPFEYSQAVVAWLTGLEFLDIYHVLAPAFFGFLIPLAWFYVITRFAFSNWAAVAGTFLICLSLLLMGEQPRAIGNQSFNRLFQGKIVMFSLLLPLTAAWGMDFMRAPSAKRWLRCFAAATSGVGLTTCASFLLPMLALLTAASAGFTYVGDPRRILTRGFRYGTAFVYPAMYALSFLLVSSADFNPMYEGQMRTFSGHAAYVLKGPVTNTLVAAATILSLLVLRKGNRRFIAAWVVLMIVMYANPLSARFLIPYVTSPAVYYRVLFLYPFPLVLGLVGAAVATWAGRLSLPKRAAVYGAVSAALILGHLPPKGPSIFRQQLRPTRIQSGYKLWGYSTAREVIELGTPPGTMLATPHVSFSIGSVTSAYPQMRIKKHGINMWLSERGKQDEVIHRIRASEFLGDWVEHDPEEAKASITLLLERYPRIRSVVALKTVADEHNLHAFLERFGFTEMTRGKHLAVFTRQSNDQRVRPQPGLFMELCKRS
jgi:hypothetical protein